MSTNGEAVTIEFRVANVAHPILSVSKMSKKGIQGVLGHNYGYLQRGPKRLDLTCSDELCFLRAKMESGTSAEHLQSTREVHECAPVMREGRDGDGDEDDDPNDAEAYEGEPETAD